MPVENVDIDGIIYAIMEDLANPTLHGEYQLDFMVQTPFIDNTEMSLSIQITPEGHPKFAFPEGINSPTQFAQIVQSFAFDPRLDRYKETLIFLHKGSETGIEKSWVWLLEANGHLTPVDLAQHAAQYGVHPSQLANMHQGWTINNSLEVLIAFYESLRLLEMAQEYAADHDEAGFTIDLVIDKKYNSFHAVRIDKSRQYRLVEDHYMEVFMAFKNGVYLSRGKSRVVAKFSNESFMWVPNQGKLIGKQSKHQSEGWDLGFDVEAAEELMQHLTKQDHEMDEMVNPDPMNQPVTGAQNALLTALVPEANQSDDQVLVGGLASDSTWLSTAVMNTAQGQLVELPHVLDYFAEAEYRVLGAVKTLNKDSSNKDEPFKYHFFALNPDGSVSELTEYEKIQVTHKMH